MQTLIIFAFVFAILTISVLISVNSDYLAVAEGGEFFDLLHSKVSIAGKRRLADTDACKMLWRDDELVGRCFGLKSLDEYKIGGMAVPTAVTSAGECKELCCKLGSGCVTWQYWETDNACKIGGPIRLGTEGAENDNWCEPNQPRKWHGRKVMARHVNDLEDAPKAGHREKGKYKCEWGDELPTQCFGLGAERMTTSPHEMAHFTGREEYHGGRLSRKGCAKSCCNTDGCSHWQELPDRGCFHNDNSSNHASIHCESYMGTFVGGRKCVRHFCGSKDSPDALEWIPPFKSNWGEGDRKKKKNS